MVRRPIFKETAFSKKTIYRDTMPGRPGVTQGRPGVTQGRPGATQGRPGVKRKTMTERSGVDPGSSGPPICDSPAGPRRPSRGQRRAAGCVDEARSAGAENPLACAIGYLYEFPTGSPGCPPAAGRRYPSPPPQQQSSSVPAWGLGAWAAVGNPPGVYGPCSWPAGHWSVPAHGRLGTGRSLLMASWALVGPCSWPAGHWSIPAHGRLGTGRSLLMAGWALVGPYPALLTPGAAQSAAQRVLHRGCCTEGAAQRVLHRGAAQRCCTAVLHSGAAQRCCTEVQHLCAAPHGPRPPCHTIRCLQNAHTLRWGMPSPSRYRGRYLCRYLGRSTHIVPVPIWADMGRYGGQISAQICTRRRWP
eukprot:gene25296-biopygen20962